MRKQILLAAVSMMAVGSLMAAEKAVAAASDEPVSREKQLENLGVVRARVIARLESVGKLLAGDKNGAGTVYALANAAFTKVQQAANKTIGEENAKPQEMRNQAVLEAANKKTQKNNEMWNEFLNKEWPTYSKGIAEQVAVNNSMNQLYVNYFSNVEGLWNNAGLDVELLSNILEAMGKRLEDVKVKASPVVADMVKVGEKWDAFSKE